MYNQKQIVNKDLNLRNPRIHLGIVNTVCALLKKFIGPILGSIKFCTGSLYRKHHSIRHPTLKCVSKWKSLFLVDSIFLIALKQPYFDVLKLPLSRCVSVDVPDRWSRCVGDISMMRRWPHLWRCIATNCRARRRRCVADPDRFCQYSAEIRAVETKVSKGQCLCDPAHYPFHTRKHIRSYIFDRYRQLGAQTAQQGITQDTQGIILI